METIEGFEMFHGPCTILISGPTGSGKSQLTRKILFHRQKLFASNPPQKILYCYNVFQPLFEQIEYECPGIVFHQGLPSEQFIDQFSSDRVHSICVLDDLAHLASKSDLIEILYTQKSHHMNITPILITHNLFTQNKNFRTISLNTQYFCLFPSFRDSGQMKCLAKQIFPNNMQCLLNAYEDVMKKKYGYLIINVGQHAPRQDLRIFSDIFEDAITVYKC